MKKLVCLSLFISLFIASCSEDEAAYDPYANWQVRNEAWYRSVADSARTAIAEARAQWGDAWEDHCQWRMFKTLYQAQDYNTGKLTDSVCVRIETRGTGTYSPAWTDTVRISFRGWMMPATYRLYNENNVEVDSVMQEIFSQTYFGPYDKETAAPQLSAVTPFVEGFNTALQYMVKGDDWNVYIPHQLAYGSSDNGTIKAYSTLLFRIQLVDVYPCGSGVPDWK